MNECDFTKDEELIGMLWSE